MIFRGGKLYILSANFGLTQSTPDTYISCRVWDADYNFSSRETFQINLEKDILYVSTLNNIIFKEIAQKRQACNKVNSFILPNTWTLNLHFQKGTVKHRDLIGTHLLKKVPTTGTILVTVHQSNSCPFETIFFVLKRTSFFSILICW